MSKTKDGQDYSAIECMCQTKLSPQRLASALLNDVYYPMTLCVSLNKEGYATQMHMFDSDLYTEKIRFAEDVVEVWCFVNHPEGYPHLFERDWKILKRVAEESGAACMRVYMTGEEFGCRALYEERRLNL